MVFVIFLILCQLPVSSVFAETLLSPTLNILKTREDLLSSFIDDTSDSGKIEKINSILNIETGILVEKKTADGSLPIAAPSTVFTIDKFLFTGNSAIPSVELEKLAKEVLHHPVKMEDVQAFVSEVKRFYRSKGYIASYAYVPPQVLEKNTMTIAVVEGRLEDMTVSGNNRVSEKILRAQFSAKPGEVISYENFSGDLERLNAHRDIEAKALLKPGTAPGTTDIDLKVKEKSPLHLNLDTNNLGTQDTGVYRLGVGFSNSNVSGRLDEASSRVEWGTHSWAIMADYNTPVTPRGTRVGLQASRASNAVGGDFAALDIEGDATTVGVYALEPWVRTSNFSADIRAGFDMKNVENRILGFVSGEDDLRILNGGFQLEYKTPVYRWLSSHMLYRGIDALGATKALDEEGFGFGTRSNFLAYRGSFTYHQKFLYDTFGLARVVVQAASNALPSSERLRLGGAYSVRGYTENEYSADYGAYANFEYYVPFDKPFAMIPKGWHMPGAKESLIKKIQWVFFMDMGRGGINNGFIGEELSRDLLGAGVGLRMKLYDNVYFRIDLAAPLSGLRGTEPTESDKHSAVYFGLSSEVF